MVIGRTRTAYAGVRTGGSYLEESQEGEESAAGWSADDALKAGREGQGLRRPRARLQGWRLQKARVQSRAQVAQGRVARGGHEQRRSRGLRRLPRPLQARSESRGLPRGYLVPRHRRARRARGSTKAPTVRRTRRTSRRRSETPKKSQIDISAGVRLEPYTRRALQQVSFLFAEGLTILLCVILLPRSANLRLSTRPERSGAAHSRAECTSAG